MVKIWMLYVINSTIATIIAFIFHETGWINCAFQLWGVTVILYINKI